MIRASNLVKTFGKVTAVDGITFEVPAGEIFAFLGPNGAGKTTTIQMLTALARPTSGTIAIDGFDPVSQPFEVRRSFGIVFQDPSVDLEATAYENMHWHCVLYGIARRARRERIEEMMRLFEVWERRRDRVKTFSGGMRRRLEIARGLLHSPKVLFLDEPTLGLDPDSRHRLWTIVRNLNAKNGVTVFLTTHYIDECERVAHRVAIIDHGRIVAEGSPRDLRERTGSVESLEAAFLALTASAPRDDDATAPVRPAVKLALGSRR